ncbi:hypothetical protein DFJ77DRAFT_430953 [Powellomyces hirtus]|nr:hypothetical protein DFJ77DRAFT_430953 [Powellomyces hirtus]
MLKASPPDNEDAPRKQPGRAAKRKTFTLGYFGTIFAEDNVGESHSKTTATKTGSKRSHSAHLSSASSEDDSDDYDASLKPVKRLRQTGCGDTEDITSRQRREHKCCFPGCERTFRKSSKLQRHERTHSDARPFKCPRCTKDYARREHLARHALTHADTVEEQKPFRCDEPDCARGAIGFASQYHLNRHRKWHETPRPYKCTIASCTEAFAKRTQLRNHMCEHTGKKPFACTSCEKTFSRVQKLQAHEQTHRRSYECGRPDCSEMFSRWSALQAHIKDAHKPACRVCKKSFSHKDTLRDHMKSHDAERETFPCEWDGCGKIFTKKRNRNAHQRATHEGRTAFACDHEDCGQTFLYKHSLVNHNKRSHEQQRQSSTEAAPKKKRVDAIPPPNILEVITGFNYAEEGTGRNLECPVNGCRFAYKRKYDLKRHLHSCHPDEELPAEEYSL